MSTKNRLFTFAALLFLATPLLALAVTVGPARLEYSADPGQSFEGKLFVRNEGDSTRTFYAAFERFTEENGGKIFTRETSNLSSWFRMPASVTLGPDEEKQIPFTIEVPSDAAPGGHFAVIWWGTAPPGADGEQVSIVTRAGILVYLTVSGDIQESGKITRFATEGGRVFSKPPVSFSLEFQNEGNVAAKPVGEIRLRNVFGVPQAKVSVNPHGIIILPKGSKTITTELPAGNGLLFGAYRAEAALNYGAEKTEVRKSFWIFFFPPLMTAIAAIIILLVLFFPKFIRRYNAWVIRRSRNGS